MNLVLKNLLKNTNNKKDDTSSPPLLMNIRTEKQDRPLPDDLEEQQDLPFGDPGRELFADVVYPKDSHLQLLPVMVFVHGGALVTGNRKSDRVFCQELARLGFVVYSVEYRLIDRADAFGMVSDVCGALALVSTTAKQFGGDPGRVSLCGESAGAFLALYTAATGKSEALRGMFGCEEYGLDISALILFSGMLYTTGNDLIGLVYKKELYREKRGDRVFMSSIVPDSPQFLSLLPPVFLVSSKADFLRKHTLKYAKALEQAHHEYKLMYYPKGKELTHAFPALLPSQEESRDVINAIRDWLLVVTGENP